MADPILDPDAILPQSPWRQPNAASPDAGSAPATPQGSVTPSAAAPQGSVTPSAAPAERTADPNAILPQSPWRTSAKDSDTAPHVDVAPDQKPADTSGGFWDSNVGAGIERMPGTAAGAIPAIASLYKNINPSALVAKGVNYLFPDSTAGKVADAINTYNPVNMVASGLSQLPSEQTVTSWLGMHPAQPDGLLGKIVQDTVAGAPIAAIGGGGLPAFALRQAANLGGTTAADTTTAMVGDNHPLLAAGAGLLGSILGDRVPAMAVSTGKGLANVGSKVWNGGDETSKAVQQAAANQLAQNTNTTGSDLVSQINQGTKEGQWAFSGLPEDQQPAPTLADVTSNQGVRNLTYADQAAAKQAGNAVYDDNRQQTNASQRAAVAAVAPTDIDPGLASYRATLTTGVAQLPPATSAQDTGSSFRSGVQSVYDQRLAARNAAGSVFDALDNSPAHIDLTPAIDYATQQAASNAGEVGSAYKAALGQFKSGTGITLDTAPFANSVLKGLSDLQSQYPPGSAAGRAVLDVRNQAEQAIFAQEPDIAAARATWEQNSKPLDVFDAKQNPGPIPNAVATTRFGGYTTPNDAVVSQFLTSKGSPDAIDALNGVFGNDVEARTQGLSDYIAGQVRARAVNPDDSIDQKALAAVLAPYQGVLTKLPFAKINAQFKTLDGAQSAINDLTNRQAVVEKFENGLGTGATDAQGNQIYSAAKFNKAVSNSDLVHAYGQDGADRINHVNDQIQEMAQTANAKVPGQSGTPQASLRPSDKGTNILTYLLSESLGTSVGAGAGSLLAGPAGAAVGAAAGGAGAAGVATLIKNRTQAFNDAVINVQRQMLTDPTFARKLLMKYDPKLPSKELASALDYVKNRLGGYIAPQIDRGP